MPRINLAKRCHSCGRRFTDATVRHNFAGSYLTQRELTVFQLLAIGYTQRQAAKKLGVRVSTVGRSLFSAASRFNQHHWHPLLEKFKSVRSETPCSEG